MPDPLDFEFVIDAYTPETMPMVRLARYLTDLATLLGNHSSVHLLGIEHGSVRPRMRIDQPDIPKVEDRLRAVRSHSAPPEAMRAYRAIDTRLARDNAKGQIVSSGSNLIEFPGRDRLREVRPFSQPGTLQGTVVSAGGRDNPPTVHLQDENRVYVCHATRAVTRRMAQHIYGRELRVGGIGRWERSYDGDWSLVRFMIHDFKELNNTQLDSLAASIRASGASHWGESEDPLGDLHELRHGE